MMTNKELATRFVTDYLNTADEEVFAKLVSPGYVDHDLPPGVTAQQSIGGFRAAFPNARFEVRDVIGEDDKVVVRYRVDGTHTGDFFGFAPTNRPIAIEGMSMYRIEAGRLAESWVHYDKAGIAQQIGMS